MLWEELHLERAYASTELVSAVASALGREASDLAVAVTPDDIPKEKRPLLLELTQLGGDFPLRVGIYVLETREPPKAALAEIVKQLGCRALISGASSNPYEFVLIDGKGQRRDVHVVPETLDEKDQLTLKSDAPDEDEVVTLVKAKPTRSSVKSAIDYMNERATAIFPQGNEQDETIAQLTKDVSVLAWRESTPSREELARVKSNADAVRDYWKSKPKHDGVQQLLKAARLILDGALS